MRRVRRVAGWAALALLIAAAGSAWWVRRELRGSLPALDGTQGLSGLTAPVTIARDDLGIPRITGRTREDVARATGFVHAQDRFFQMDLSRRRAAGELAALVGPRALPADREIRIHRFREQARRSVALASPEQRRILDAYVSGVNAGLTSLRARPFEYLVLRQQPQPWKSEDCFLVVLTMFITLQDSDGEFESSLATMQELLPAPVVDFLVPQGTEWDSPFVGERLPGAAVPGPEIYDLRARRRGVRTTPRPAGPRGAWLTDGARSGAIGSNNWAVNGRLTESGSAIVANDMHLGIRVPNTWYRAMFEWSEGSARRIAVGLTLPGVPALVSGSNGDIAWGFTNTYADTSDIVMLDVDPARPGQYRTPAGWRSFEQFTETIAVAGETPETLAVTWTMWGPVLPPDFKGRPRAYRWVAHAAEQLAFSVTPQERAHSIAEAFDEANRLGTPAQNLVVADRSGSIGWTVWGSLPDRMGVDGRLPVSWADPDRGWKGLLPPSAYPRVIDPPDGRIWTANNRVVGGALLAPLGSGNWEIGARARIIGERLAARTTFTPGDMLAIQLDTRAEFLERWRQLVLDALTPSMMSGSPARQAFRDVVEHDWNGEAAADSAAYRLTRMFRDATARRVFSFLLAECYDADPNFDYFTVQRREGPLWALVSARPRHLLDAEFASWEEFFVATVDGVIEQLQSDGAGDLRSRVWSQMNVTEFRHPLSAGIPFASRWLDMPSRALPGDLYTPRMHWGSEGASARMAVAPGRESEGIMHMPTGQSGHPLSPFYANSHAAWAEGRATPFLPETPRHTLTLVPGR